MTTKKFTQPTTRLALAAMTIALCATISACASSSSIGLVDITRISQNWPEFENYQNQFNLDNQTIANSKAGPAEKQREATALQLKYGKITAQLTARITTAATKVAQDKNLKLVLTREGVGYGGTDITTDVEKQMGITETATPTP